MTCACSAAGPCIVHDGAWARLQSIARELGRNDHAAGDPARNIMSAPIPHSELWGRIDPVAPELRLRVHRARLLGLLAARGGAR